MVVQYPQLDVVVTGKARKKAPHSPVVAAASSLPGRRGLHEKYGQP